MPESFDTSHNKPTSPVEAPTFVSKSKEILQAQLAAFITEAVGSADDRRHLFNNLPQLAESELADIIRTVGRHEYTTDELGAFTQIPEGTVKVAATKAEFLSFLRAHTGSQYESISGRAEILEAYTQFKPVVDQLKTELVGLTNGSDHPTFLGRGSNAQVFAIALGDKKYAIRIPTRLSPEYKASIAVDHHLSGAFLSKGLPHLEQIVAASYEEGVTVAEMMPGKEVGNLSASEIASITEDQLREFINTLTVAQQKGLVIDPKPSNIFYEAQVGFGVVDYTSNKMGFETGPTEIEKVISNIPTAITNSGFYGKPYSPITLESARHDLEIYKAQAVCLQRFQRVLETTAFNDLKAKMQKIITSNAESIERYSDPAWISEQIQEAEERSQRKPSFNWTQIET